MYARLAPLLLDCHCMLKHKGAAEYEPPAHLIDDLGNDALVQRNVGVAVEQRHQQALHLPRLDVTRLVQVIQLQGDCSRHTQITIASAPCQNQHAPPIGVSCSA